MLLRSRPLARTLPALVFLGLALTGCNSEESWHETDVTGSLPPLQFTMTEASDGKTVTAQDFAGTVDLIYFGYTHCPDVCPMTLANLGRVLDGLGDEAKHARVLFVTVDPERDTLSLLKQYTASFGPEVVGLRGTPDQIAALAKRYRVAYSVTPAKGDQPAEVSHSSAIYAFDESGDARLLLTSMATAKPDVEGAVADLKTLIGEAGNKAPDLLQELWQMV
ncbi:SCO family protein [Methyloligella sp. 2.7D]|uniref:SCO family protein n=1 Tax=unclassified Methyloligella TaxID=2625955 RepID=UPI00157D3CD1|nr:SCO family protein [Methyloligella sp. GL2]QKP78086.1 SCO family protein [Methyloligella sp. GL2]